MPKSPHPGHQSLKTSVLTSSSLSMAHHRRAPGALQLLEDPLPDLVLGEGAAVELVDEAADVDAGHLADQAADLAAVVPLDHHVGLRLAQDLADRVAGEGEEEPTPCPESSSIASRIAPFVEPQPTTITSASAGPWRVHFISSGISLAAVASFVIRFVCIFTRFSADSTMCPRSLCSSPLVQKIPPRSPSRERGEIPFFVNL